MLNDILKALPYRMTVYDKEGKAVYDNQSFDGSLVIDNSPKILANWIIDELKIKQTFQTSIPSDSFNQTLYSYYQVSKDQSGHIQGYVEVIYDFKEALKNYLDETGQALVGWSDATSGPSFTSDQDY